MERALVKLQTQAGLVRVLHRVLLKKRSQTSHMTFSDAVEVCFDRFVPPCSARS